MVFTFLILIGLDFQSCISTERVELKILSSSKSLIWHTHHCCSYPKSFLFCIWILIMSFSVLKHNFFLYEMTAVHFSFVLSFACLFTSPNTLSIFDFTTGINVIIGLIPLSAHTIYHITENFKYKLRGYEISTRHSGRSLVFWVFNLF